jgi:hypothetical protein
VVYLKRRILVAGNSQSKQDENIGGGKVDNQPGSKQQARHDPVQESVGSLWGVLEAVSSAWTQKDPFAGGWRGPAKSRRLDTGVCSVQHSRFAVSMPRHSIVHDETQRISLLFTKVGTFTLLQAGFDGSTTEIF